MLCVCPALPNTSSWFVFFHTYVISKLEQKHIYKSSVNRLVSKRAFNTVMAKKKKPEKKKSKIKVKTNVRVKPSVSACGHCFIPVSPPVPMAGFKSVKFEGNVDATQSAAGALRHL